MVDLFFSCVQTAYERSKSLLWPYKGGVWARLFFVFLFIGGCQSFPPMNFNFAGNDQAREIPAVGQAEEPPAEDPGLENLTRSIESAQATYRDNKSLFWKVFSGIAGFFLLFILFFIWFSSRLTLVSFHLVETGRVKIREAWKQTASLGWSFFFFRVLLLCVPLIIGFSVLLSVSGMDPSQWKTMLISGVLSLILALMIFTVLYFSLDSFIPAVMYLKTENSRAAFFRALRYARGNFFRGAAAVFLFGAMVMALGVGLAILMMLVGGLIFLPLGIGAAFLIGLAGGFSAGAKAAMAVGAVLVVLIFGFFFAFLAAVPVGTFSTYLKIELVRREMKRLEENFRIPEA